MITKEFVYLSLAIAFIISIICILIYNVLFLKSASKIPDYSDDSNCEEIVDYDDLKIINK